MILCRLSTDRKKIIVLLVKSEVLFRFNDLIKTQVLWGDSMQADLKTI